MAYRIFTDSSIFPAFALFSLPFLFVRAPSVINAITEERPQEWLAGNGVDNADCVSKTER